MAVGGIMAAAITGTNTWVGVPVAVGSLGAALAAWPLSLHGPLRAPPGSGHRLRPGGGRRRAGDGRCPHAKLRLLLVGMTLFGISNTSNLLARYAAADVTPAAHRGRAMGLIVWGSTLGSIVGPNLMTPVVRLGARAQALAGGQRLPHQHRPATRWRPCWCELLLRPDPLAIASLFEERATAERPARPPRAAARDPGRAARAHRGRHADVGPARDDRHHLHVAGLSARPRDIRSAPSASPWPMHLGGMYVASPLSGWLSDRFGRLMMIGVGAFVLAAGGGGGRAGARAATAGW